MSVDTTIRTRTGPRIRVLHRPEDVHLQMRLETRYVGINLTFEEAIQVASALLAAVEDGKKPSAV